MTYLIFNENGNYTDEDGNPATLGQHLSYLRNWGGTPDHWDAAETKGEARKLILDRAPVGTWVIISEELDFRPVDRIHR